MPDCTGSHKGLGSLTNMVKRDKAFSPQQLENGLEIAN